jgi:hypothetical protein
MRYKNLINKNLKKNYYPDSVNLRLLLMTCFVHMCLKKKYDFEYTLLNSQQWTCRLRIISEVT